MDLLMIIGATGLMCCWFDVAAMARKYYHGPVLAGSVLLTGGLEPLTRVAEEQVKAELACLLKRIYDGTTCLPISG